MKAVKKTDPPPKKASAFSELGLKATVAALKKHDEFTNKVIVPKFQGILPSLP